MFRHVFSAPRRHLPLDRRVVAGTSSVGCSFEHTLVVHTRTGWRT